MLVLWSIYEDEHNDPLTLPVRHPGVKDAEQCHSIGQQRHSKDASFHHELPLSRAILLPLGKLIVRVACEKAMYCLTVAVGMPVPRSPAPSPACGTPGSAHRLGRDRHGGLGGQIAGQ
jgi:hypothetical protein